MIFFYKDKFGPNKMPQKKEYREGALGIYFTT